MNSAMGMGRSPAAASPLPRSCTASAPPLHLLSTSSAPPLHLLCTPPAHLLCTSSRTSYGPPLTPPPRLRAASAPDARPAGPRRDAHLLRRLPAHDDQLLEIRADRPPPQTTAPQQKGAHHGLDQPRGHKSGARQSRRPQKPADAGAAPTRGLRAEPASGRATGRATGQQHLCVPGVAEKKRLSPSGASRLLPRAGETERERERERSGRNVD